MSIFAMKSFFCSNWNTVESDSSLKWRFVTKTLNGFKFRQGRRPPSFFATQKMFETNVRGAGCVCVNRNLRTERFLRSAKTSSAMALSSIGGSESSLIRSCHGRW